MQRLYLNPDFLDRLEREGLTSFASLGGLNHSGATVSETPGRTTRRITLQGENFYFKSVEKPTPSSALEALLTLRRPHHYCWREMQQVESLRQSEIAVMEVAAAGEESRWGVPRSSFILVREVPGESLQDVIASAPGGEQIRWLEKLGLLVGSLHRAGFFTPVRLKDVIVDSSGRLVLIDRETRKPGPRRFSRRKALRSLQRTLWRQRRDGIEWTSPELNAHLDAYLSQTSQWLDLEVDQLGELIKA